MPLTVTGLSLHSSVFVSPMPATLSCSPGAAAVGSEGTFGMDGTEMLGMRTPGKLGIELVDLFTMKNPTAPAMTMNTTAAITKTTHGTPADDFRGGGGDGHGAP